MRARSLGLPDFCMPRFSRGAISQAEAFTSDPADKLCRNPSIADCAAVMFPLLNDGPICESRASNELLLELEPLDELVWLVSAS